MGRRDAFRIKRLNGMEQILIDLKPRRCDSDVYINHQVDVTDLVKYIDKKKEEGKDVTFFHAFVTALGKVIYNRRKLNRFIANRHVYEHNEVVISFVAKVSFSDKAEEMMIMVPFNENDNISKRMTHVQMVAKIARTIGRALRLNEDLIEAIALGHDVGHTPFGHKGEKAVQTYFRKTQGLVGQNIHSELLNDIERKDLQNIEGNAQGFRILCHLALADDDYSYNLTCPILSTIIKYPFSSNWL